MKRVLLVLVLATAVSCKKKPPEDAGGGLAGDNAGAAAGATITPAAPIPDTVQQMARNFSKVFFEFDSSALTADGKAALDENASIMSGFPDVRLEIQGHADERGTTDYNMALGQKRADAVVQYLLARGVASSRVRSVSYGEERPADDRHTERAWDANRRAEFVISWSGGAPVTGSAGG
jgi:peptidoglycan-associated lipoprotein